MTNTLTNLSTQPYGTQREACLVGTFDPDGWLVDNPMPRAVFAFQIDGALDPAKLTSALHRAAMPIDAWRARLRKFAGGFVLVANAGESSEPVAVTMTPSPISATGRVASASSRPPGDPRRPCCASLARMSRRLRSWARRSDHSSSGSQAAASR